MRVNPVIITRIDGATVSSVSSPRIVSVVPGLFVELPTFSETSGSPGSIRSGYVAMEPFARVLSTRMGRIVLDRTGLAGQFQIELTFTPVSERVLRPRDLNRAVLARQLLLERAALPLPREVLKRVRRVIQAQGHMRRRRLIAGIIAPGFRNPRQR